MEITRNVIHDLLPAYIAGEASADTRALIEEFLRRDPELGSQVEEQKKLGPLDSTLKGTPTMPMDHEVQTLARTKTLLVRRTWLLALAIAFSLAPLSFTFDNGHITWMMFRHVPRLAFAYAFFAAGFWLAWLVTNHRLRSTGL
jgi:anti-sigma factor RsiW